MSFVKWKLTSRQLADVTLVVTVIDNPKLLNILMISFFFLSLLCRNKFLNIPKPSSLYNPTLFCHSGTYFIGNKCTSSHISPPSWHLIETSKSSSRFFFTQGSSWWNNNVSLAFNWRKYKVKRLSKVSLYNL